MPGTTATWRGAWPWGAVETDERTPFGPKVPRIAPRWGSIGTRPGRDPTHVIASWTAERHPACVPLELSRAPSRRRRSRAGAAHRPARSLSAPLQRGRLPCRMHRLRPRFVLAILAALTAAAALASMLWPAVPPVPRPLVHVALVDPYAQPPLDAYGAVQLAQRTGDRDALRVLAEGFLALRLALWLARDPELPASERLGWYERVLELRIDDPLERAARRALHAEVGAVAEEAGYDPRAIAAYREALPNQAAIDGLERLDPTPTASPTPSCRRGCRPGRWPRSTAAPRRRSRRPRCGPWGATRRPSTPSGAGSSRSRAAARRSRARPGRSSRSSAGARRTPRSPRSAAPPARTAAAWSPPARAASTTRWP
jgi:hypothetical protein